MIIHHLVETAAARIYSLVAGLIIVLVTARILGPHGQGVIAGAVAWVALIASMAGLSLGQVSQHIIQTKQRRNWLPGLFGSLLFLLGVLSLLALVASGVIYVATNGRFFGSIDPRVLGVAFCMLPMLVWDEYSSNLLASAGRLRAYNLAQIAGRTLWMVLSIILIIGLGLGVYGALLAQILGQLLVALISIYLLWVTAGRFIYISRAEISHILHGSTKLHLNTIASFLLMQTSTLVLTHYASKAEVGWFYLSWQMVTVLSVIPQSVAIVLYSKMAEIGPDGVWPIQKRLIVYVLIAIAVVVALVYFIGPDIIVQLAGSQYARSAKLFQLLLPTLFGMGLAQVMAPQWIGRGLLLHTTVLTVITAIANLIAHIILVPKYGVLGAVWSTVLMLSVVPVFVQLGFMYWCEQKYVASLHRGHVSAISS